MEYILTYRNLFKWNTVKTSKPNSLTLLLQIHNASNHADYLGQLS